MKLRAARGDDRDVIIALLEAESLPTSDIESRMLANFIVAEDHAAVAGCIGVERFDDCALLRSLVVSAYSRGRGTADKLISELEARLSSSGVTDVWLLTTDASEYFSQRGYVAQSRDVVPESIRGTAEFSNLCPGDAVVMRKSLR